MKSWGKWVGKADVAAGTGKDDRGRYSLGKSEDRDNSVAQCGMMREVKEGFSLKGTFGLKQE